LAALVALRAFLYDRVYENPLIRDEFEKAQRILGELWAHYHGHADEFRAKSWPKGTREEEGLDRAVGDFLSGRTDRYAVGRRGGHAGAPFNRVSSEDPSRAGISRSVTTRL